MNVISAVSFQIRTRARELAVLKSVGITSESLEKMLNIESVLCSGKALVTGLPVGIPSCSDHGILCKNGFPDFLSYALGSHSDRDCSFLLE